MSKAQFAFLVALTVPLLSACAGTGGDIGGSSPQLAGDENGGKIQNSLGSASEQSSAYRMVTAHCEKFGKKGIIIKMDYDSGTLSFDCRLQKSKPAA